MKKALYLFQYACLALAIAFLTVSCEDEEDNPAGGEKLITSFSFLNPISASGTIDEANRMITVDVPFNADLTNVTGTVIASDGAVVSPDLSVGVDFSSLSVDFVVNNNDAISTYTVNVAVGDPPAIQSLAITSPFEATGTVDELNRTIALTAPFGTDLTNVVGTVGSNAADVTVSPDLSAGVNISGLSVPFTVSNNDGSVAYTLNVTVNSAPTMASFEVTAPFSAVGTIDDAARTIDFDAPFGADLSALTVSASASADGAIASPDFSQAVDFSAGSVVISVAKEQGTVNYTARANVGPAPQITAFQIISPVAIEGVIDEEAKTITFDIDATVDRSNLLGTVTSVNATGVTPDLAAGLDFTGEPVVFTATNGFGNVEYTATANVVVTTSPLLALVGQASTFNGIDNEIISEAYQWALDTYGADAAYLSFDQIDANPSLLDNTAAIWFHYDVALANVGDFALPAGATGSAFDDIQSFYQGGGNLLLTTHAPNYLVDLGRLPSSLAPADLNTNANFFQNPDNWGISFENDAYPAGNASHPFFEELQTTEATFNGQTYDVIYLLDGGLKRDHANLWNFFNIPAITSAQPDPNLHRAEFEAQATAVVRASFEWDPPVDGVNFPSLIEFLPTAEFQGTAVTMGIGSYEWAQPDPG